MFDFVQNFGTFALLITIIISLAIILKGADYFVKGASSISLKLGISAFVVGLTIVAIGTSAPELFINAIAAYSGATELSIGNILGSNIAGILLGLGIAAIFVPLTLKHGTVWKEIPFSLLGAIVVLIFGMDIAINGAEQNVMVRSEGLALLAFFVIFLSYTFGLNKVEDGDEVENEEDIKEYDWIKSSLFIFGGLVGLVLGGSLVVESSTALARSMGLSENLIGLTIVAIGTSLPEIITTIVAARKGQIALAVGGIVGTIIFNIFFALGVTAVIAPLPFNADNITDALFLMFISVLLFIFMFTGKKHKLERWEGIIFVCLYFSYMAFAIFRDLSSII
jgi:cation:H+ antiporter